MTTSKVGRNDPCPCGSGQKYKKCCLDKPLSPELPQNYFEQVRKNYAREADRMKQYGQVRSILSSDFQGHKIIAVGNKIHYDKSWKTFIDFLRDYVKQMFGKDWWLGEFRKPDTERSPICRWATAAHEYGKQHARKEGDLFGVVPNGPMHAYYALAYDLYVLKDHQLLQEEVLKRLRRGSEFHGARYELLVAATFIRAGFDIRYENEKDNSVRHPEFVATHKATGIEVDVEAKKRNRLVKLTAEAFNSGQGKIAVRDMLANALGKFRGRPYVICVDLDVPPMNGNPFEQPWFLELRDAPDEAGSRDLDGRDRFNMICCTNQAIDYTIESPSRFSHIHIVSQVPKISMHTLQPLWDVQRALSQFGKIPSKFE